MMRRASPSQSTHANRPMCNRIRIMQANNKWREGGTYRAAGHFVIGGLGGGGAGALASGGISLAADKLKSMQVSCPSVRNTFCIEFQPLFFQRSASRGWSLIGLRHFFDCAVPAFCTKAATRAGIAPAPCGQCCWR
jgi:hypothetical protein